MLGKELTDWANRFDDVAEKHIRSLNCPETLKSGFEYSLFNTGKRLRPLMTYAACYVYYGNIALADTPALAVELVHTYSLIHDDLPAIDNDFIRRGKPSSHVQFGEGKAILIGDAMQSSAFELLSSSQSVFLPEIQIRMISILAAASGCRGIASGQMIDISNSRHDNDTSSIVNLYKLKTGSLIRASLLMGALSSGKIRVGDESALDLYSDSIGLAYQIMDDILDMEGCSEIVGKSCKADMASGKTTYPMIVGLDEAKSVMAKLRDIAIGSIKCFGPTAKPLIDLANYVVNRDS